eukprot:CAMPEP_0172741266 /NCGR_PEP_ID=MMETSP1074-20121228/126812_1 /TAXON_ID=2916 /ORGANISM="Ceratium fusus, Strain PA161109" /LENGTH=47 /DNA_ID= /DNA_START= /DNA_END= /DNA_ORIENTATION=
MMSQAPNSRFNVLGLALPVNVAPKRAVKKADKAMVNEARGEAKCFAM